MLSLGVIPNASEILEIIPPGAVKRIESPLAVGLGEKSYVTLSGDVAAVEAGWKNAVEAGMLVAKTVILAPKEAPSRSLL